MSWVFLDEKLSNKGLTQVPLEALHPDCQEYDVMLYQHGGQMSADANAICNLDHDEAATKFSSFISLAVHKQPQLMITPEYSCPWSVIEDSIQNNRWPRAGNAWILGCESIQPAELEDLRDRYNNVTWLVASFTPERDQIFLDVACIFMTATSRDGTEVKLIVVQPKGCAMADGCYLIEPNSLILGNDRFVLRNDPDSIHLAIFVCSDALEEEILTTLPQVRSLPYLLLHIQLNGDPRNLSFRAYRDFWGTHNLNKTEIICLNWARGIEVFGNSIQFGGSAWYYKSQAVQASDSEVNNSHKLGVYYTNNRKRYFHCHILNYTEHVFHFRSAKICQTRSLPPTHLPRLGPRTIATYSWDSVSSEWKTGIVDDGFTNICNIIGGDLSPLTDTDMSPVDKERLVCLSNAEIRVHSERPWPHVCSLRSFELTSDEVCQRITFCHDPDQESMDRREQQLQRFKVLKDEILSGSSPFPEHMRQLQGDGRIQYHVSAKYQYNVTNVDGEYPAIFVYLGEFSENYAKEKMSDLGHILGDARRSLVVWFRQNGELRYVCPDGLTDFDANLRESLKSIVREVPA